MLRIFCLLLLFALPVCGQVPTVSASSSNTTVAGPAEYTAADTVAALHKLFRARRGGGTLLVVTSGAIMVTTAAILSSNTDATGRRSNSQAAWNGIGVGMAISIPFAILGDKAASRYTKELEKSAVGLYQETHRLPPQLSVQLQEGRFLRAREYSPWH